MSKMSTSAMTSQGIAPTSDLTQAPPGQIDIHSLLNCFGRKFEINRFFGSSFFGIYLPEARFLYHKIIAFVFVNDKFLLRKEGRNLIRCKIRFNL